MTLGAKNQDFRRMVIGCLIAALVSFAVVPFLLLGGILDCGFLFFCLGVILLLTAAFQGYKWKFWRDVVARAKANGFTYVNEELLELPIPDRDEVWFLLGVLRGKGAFALPPLVRATCLLARSNSSGNVMVIEATYFEPSGHTRRTLKLICACVSRYSVLDEAMELTTNGAKGKTWRIEGYTVSLPVRVLDDLMPLPPER